MDIQYNRNEDFKTVILPNTTTTSTTAASKSDAMEQAEGKDDTDASVTEATLLLDDQKDIETTVIFLPNIWSLMPNSAEYVKMVEAYKNFIENPPEEEPEPAKEATITTKKEAEETATNTAAETAKAKFEEPKPAMTATSEKKSPSKEAVAAPEQKLAVEVTEETTNEVNSIESLAKSIKAHTLFRLLKKFRKKNNIL